MPTKREILERLRVNDLQSLLVRYVLQVEDRRRRGDFVEALSGARRVPLEEILGELSRDTLKDLCAAFGLENGGRAKAPLIERLLGKEATRGKTMKPAMATDAVSAAPKPRVTAEEAGKLTQQQLESHLWGAADILLGRIDAADFKQYLGVAKGDPTSTTATLDKRQTHGGTRLPVDHASPAEVRLLS
jgi:type I restriction enzyme M protein